MAKDFERTLMAQPPEDVQVTMQEEDCVRCFGCPYATVYAAVITKAATRTHEITDELATLELEPFDDPVGHIADIVASNEQLQVDCRDELRTVTTSCVGWLDGAGTDTAPRPRNMCNSPNSEDPKISIAAGWLLEKIENRFGIIR